MNKEELEREKCELLGIIQEKDKAIAELEAENGAKKYAEFYFQTNEKLTKAKEIIREFVDNVERYSINNEILDRADDFLNSEVRKFMSLPEEV